MIFRCIFLVFFSWKVSLAEEKNYYSDRERGWFWKERNLKIKTKKNQSGGAPATARQVLKKQGEDWEEAVANAVLNPTRENIRDYVVKTEAVTSQADRFSKAFEAFILHNPDHNFLLKNPASSKAIMAKNREKSRSVDLELKALSRRYGLVYFFSGSCSACLSFSPILKKFENDYSFSVLPISVDGKGIKEFPRFKKNVYLANKLKIKITPSLFLVEPDSGKIRPVSFGFTGFEELKKRVLISYREISK